MADTINTTDFQLELSAKPVGGVVTVAIPEKLAALLAEKTPEALSKPDYELTLSAADEKSAKVLAGYAKAWGARQDPKLYIRKLPNGKQYPANVARLEVSKDEDVPAESRPGRKTGK